MTSEELDRCLPVCHALADLFLDTELQERDYKAIASVVLASPLSEGEVRALLFDEIAPRFAPNLFVDIAGEWVGWHLEIVREIMAEPKPRQLRWFASQRQVTQYVERQWGRVLAARSPDGST